MVLTNPSKLDDGRVPRMNRVLLFTLCFAACEAARVLIMPSGDAVKSSSTRLQLPARAHSYGSGRALHNRARDTRTPSQRFRCCPAARDVVICTRLSSRAGRERRSPVGRLGTANKRTQRCRVTRGHAAPRTLACGTTAFTPCAPLSTRLSTIGLRRSGKACPVSMSVGSWPSLSMGARALT